jgi:hypothetical protein
VPDLTPATYLTALDTLTSTARGLLLIADTVNIAELRRICGEMEALAPVLEPTAYIRGGMTNLSDQAAFLAAVDRFVTDVKKLDRREVPANG